MKKYILIIFIFCLTQESQAQFSLTKNYTNYKSQTNNSKNFSKAELNLPFFDDFSTYRGNPDLALWLDTGGVYVNNEMAVLPPTQGVATFDGVDKNGNPYEFSDVINQAIGLADQLISDTIKLGGLTLADNVYLSFFWQREGRGERPNIEDSLRLQFKDKSDEWITVWSEKGGDAMNDFEQVLIQLDSEDYFFDEFQFRFQAFGRLSGLYDAWHIDYVYLDSERSDLDIFVRDIAPTDNPTNLLKNYTAMPINQYLANQSEELNPEISIFLENLNDNFNPILDSLVIRDTINNTTFYQFSNTTFPNPATDIPEEGRSITFDITGFSLPLDTDKVLLENRLFFNTGDTETDIPPINLRRNDTIVSYTSLQDYYAYDDGSAEYGAGVNQRFGRVAIEFNLNEKDTLTDALIHVTQLEQDLTGQTFIFTVWKEIGAQDSVLLRLSVPITYSETRNEFLSIKEIVEASFSDFPAIELEGQFYIGWEQTTNDRMTVGYDRNNDSSSKIFFNTGNQWLQWEPPADETGSLMLRPVFGEADIVTSLENDISKSFKVYPNPTSDNLYFKGEKPKAIYIFDLKGKLVFETYNPQKELDLSSLSQGLYILKADFGSKGIVNKKIVIRR